MIYFEQPKIFYFGEMFIYYYFTENNKPNIKFFTSILQFNQEIEKENRFIPLIKTRVYDENNDNLIDKFDFRIAFNKEPSEEIKNIKILFLFNYSLSENVKGNMITPASINIDTPHGAGYIRINGDLNLYQKAPLTKNTFEQYDYSNVFGSDYTEQKEYDEILKEFSERNVSTIFEYDRFVAPLRSRSTVQIDITVNIPSFQKILYSTPQLTKFKFFWVQLMAIFIPCYIIFDIILVFLFKNKIFPCSITSDLPKIKNL
jgi:hypothetical protein